MRKDRVFVGRVWYGFEKQDGLTPEIRERCEDATRHYCRRELSFVLRPELGKGRFSDVYQASTIGTGTNVAVKVLRCPARSLTEVFEREVEALRELQHENVVGFLAHDLTDDGFPFIVTEFCQYPVEPARRWMTQQSSSLHRCCEQLNRHTR